MGHGVSHPVNSHVIHNVAGILIVRYPSNKLRDTNLPSSYLFDMVDRGSQKLKGTYNTYQQGRSMQSTISACILYST